MAYAAVAVVIGVIHNHSDPDGIIEEHHCAACSWQVGATTDVPLVFILVLIGFLLVLMVADESLSIPAVFFLAVASRGPPAACA